MIEHKHKYYLESRSFSSRNLSHYFDLKKKINLLKYVDSNKRIVPPMIMIFAPCLGMTGDYNL